METETPVASPEALAFAARLRALPEWADPSNHLRLVAQGLDAAHLAAAQGAMDLPANGLTFVEHTRVHGIKGVAPEDYVPIAYDAQVTGYGFGPVQFADGRRMNSVILSLTMALPSEWFNARGSQLALGRPPNPIPGAVPLVSSRLVVPRACLSALGLAAVKG